MPEITRPPLSRRLQARFFRVINVPMRLILGLPVATPLGRNLMLAFVIGRKSGKTYRQPVSYVRDGDALLTPGGGKWKLNLVAGTPVRLRLRGRDVSATPELVGDVDEVGRLLSTMAAGNPATARFVGIQRAPDGSFDQAGVERAVQYGFRIVRWHPVAAA
jgi:deazaflavin-dependent oxidoreductase (nitroreductase family)